jgi:pimeloyl-ACP methyl ester carboxylesterase/N-acetylglutamate synthase-like GNAT family acetyltransferase
VIDIRGQDDARLALHDFGGSGPPLLLLPGLCGYAGEWAAVAETLTDTFHVFALDPRGHGDSERRPADVSRDAHVADTAAALHITGKAVLVGQSMGGHTAMLTAARHPGLVERLVLVEAGPDGDDTGTTAAKIGRWLASWPVPFPDRQAAVDFLGSQAWAGGLRAEAGGLWPRFDNDIMVATVAAAARPRWEEFEAIGVPVLVVKGGKGFMTEAEFARMRLHPRVTAVRIPAAGHDVHLDAPEALAKLIATGVWVEETTAGDADLGALLEAAFAELVRRYGPEGRSSVHPQARFVVARTGGVAAGCGALQPTEVARLGEIKRMFVLPEHRGKGLAGAILAELEALAVRAGYSGIRLTTGIRQPEAIALYEKHGYERTEPYGKYVGEPTSRCYVKKLPST